MLFDFDLVIPAHTPANTPVELDVNLTGGILTEIRVDFPPGPATLVHVRVFDALLQIAPTNPDGDLNFDDKLIIVRLNYDLQYKDNVLKLVGWSPTAVFEHTITFQFEIMPPNNQTYNNFITQLEGK